MFYSFIADLNFITTLVKEWLLCPDNIKEKYGYDDEDYKGLIFDDYCTEDELFYEKFVDYITENKLNKYQILYAMLPAVLEYEQNDMGYVCEWIENGNEPKILTTYALSIAGDIVDKYQNYIYEIRYGTTSRKIAISKLKRNKLVNEGILLKLSMKNCGMF